MVQRPSLYIMQLSPQVKRAGRGQRIPAVAVPGLHLPFAQKLQSPSLHSGYRLLEKGQSFFGLTASGSVCLQMTVPAGTVPAVVTIVGAYSRHPCPNSRYLLPCSSTSGNSFKTSIDHPFKFFDDFSMLFLRWRLWPSLKRLVKRAGRR